MKTTTPKAPRKKPPASATATETPKTSQDHDTSKEAEEAVARRVMNGVFAPETGAAFSMFRIMDNGLKQQPEITPTNMMEKLERDAAAVEAGDLSQVRRTLSAQAALLDQMFHHLITQATRPTNSADLVALFMRLAMRAQTQSMRTLRELAKISHESRAPQAAPPEPEPTPEPEPPPCACHEDKQSTSPVARTRVEDAATFMMTLPVVSGQREVLAPSDSSSIRVHPRHQRSND